MQLSVIQIGNPLLREVAEELSLAQIESAEIQSFIDDLIETKRALNGAGIAAPQVGRSLRIFVVEVGNNPRYPYKPQYPLTVLINPEITFLTEERFQNFEGCLSIPDLRGVVSRCPEIRVCGLDRHGQQVDFEVRGISAGTFQHEDDHLNGILFPDRVEDTKTFCSWSEFHKHHEAGFRREVERIVARYGS